MAELFDEYKDNYKAVVDDSIEFSGLKHDFFLRAKVDPIKRHLQANGITGSTLRALDVGCGIGALHPYVRSLFGSLEGCDISAGAIAQARLNNPEIPYKAYSGGRLPYEDASFDFASAVCVVHHVPPSEWPRFFAEMRRILKPGGIAAIIEHNPLNPATRLAVLRCPFDEDAVLLRSGTTRNLMRDAGFQSMSQEFFLLLPSAGSFARRFERLLSSLPLGAQYACFAHA